MRVLEYYKDEDRGTAISGAMEMFSDMETLKLPPSVLIRLYLIQGLSQGVVSALTRPELNVPEIFSYYHLSERVPDSQQIANSDLFLFANWRRWEKHQVDVLGLGRGSALGTLSERG